MEINQEKLLNLRKIVEEQPHIVWYCKDFQKLSKESLVENILNWGDFKDIQKMIDILGMQETAGIFRNQIAQKRNNYQPQIKNYFQLYFDKYAS